jgi:sialate O-acetylesterase
MLGVLKGLHLKGVLFHQGYNNAVTQNCNPKRYRVLTRLMIEGIREDFNAPDLAFGIIGLCAGGDPQNVDNFETASIDPGAYIREAQRLGLADVENQTNLVFIPGYDVIIPGLHPSKKREHGERALRWALANLYPEIRVEWRDDVELLSAEPVGDKFVLKFKGAIVSDTRTSIPEGFSLAGEDGKFYMAHARYADGKGHPSGFPNEIRVWSPLVPKPVALRYAWARSPMGNLKMRGSPDLPFPSFRTDDWDWPESEDPAESLIGGGEWNQIKAEAEERLNYRRTEEAKRGVEILQRIETLKQP